MTRILALGTLSLIVTGCASVPVSDSVLAKALDKPMTAHAEALAGDDVDRMRHTGRVVIATYDAAVGR